ncbi:MAG: hypothetical protein P4L33_08215 [Capsulimonadaceae bacterium]|nr:hypothetical protein [Capsulimonadaceae bacterium]
MPLHTPSQYAIPNAVVLLLPIVGQTDAVFGLPLNAIAVAIICVYAILLSLRQQSMTLLLALSVALAIGAMAMMVKENPGLRQYTVPYAWFAFLCITTLIEAAFANGKAVDRSGRIALGMPGVIVVLTLLGAHSLDVYPDRQLYSQAMYVHKYNIARKGQVVKYDMAPGSWGEMIVLKR